MVRPGAQVVEELVDDEQEPVVGPALLERRHHLLEQRLVTPDLAGGGERERDAELREVFLELLAQKVA